MTALSAALLFRYLGVDDGGRYVTVIALVSIAAGPHRRRAHRHRHARAGRSATRPNESR